MIALSFTCLMKSGFLAIKVNNNHMKTIEKRVVAISSKLVAEQKKKSWNPLV